MHCQFLRNPTSSAVYQVSVRMQSLSHTSLWVVVIGSGFYQRLPPVPPTGCREIQHRLLPRFLLQMSRVKGQGRCRQVCVIGGALPSHAIPAWLIPACMCFSAINGSGPAYFSELLHVYTPSRTLRSSSDTCMLEIQQYKRKTHGFRTFSCFGPLIWNSLPQDLRHCATLSSFKAKLKTFLFSQYFHPN